MTQETAKELLRKTKVIRDNFYPEPIEPEHEDEQKITFEFLSEVINYLENDTNKLSVEKLQEHLLPYKKETVQKIIDEKMQLVTADEFLKLHKESLTAIRENDKLQEQLNTAKKALTEISSTRQEVWRGGTLVGLEATEDAKIAFEALAAINK